MKEKVLLIIPAYNEEENILNTVNSIKKHSKKLDYIVINDGSTDNTEGICKDNKLNHISLVHNLGIGGAVQTGYKYALENNYDIAIQFDGDGQHDINSIEELINPIAEGQADMVIGSRFIEELSEFKSTFMRRVGLNIISFVIRLFTGKRIHDTTSGYRAINKEIIKRFAHDYPLEYPEPISSVVLIKNKYKIEEVPVKMKEREAGISSIGGNKSFTFKTAYYMINVCLSIFIVCLRRYK